MESTALVLKFFKYTRDVHGGPVAKTLHSQCRGPGFDPWSYVPQLSTE